MSKRLVAFFSASGSTARLANTLAVAANAALYEIKPAVPYERRDLNWMDKKSRSTVEMQDPNCRPALADTAAPVRGRCSISGLPHLVVSGTQHHRQLSGCLRLQWQGYCALFHLRRQPARRWTRQN